MTRLSLSLYLLTALSGLAFADLTNDLYSASITAIFPNDDRYPAASSAYNQRFEFAPAAITYPDTPEDVSKIVQIGEANNLQVVARSGGHSYIANGLGGKDGALVVDLTNIKSISIESSSQIASIETGNRLGDIAVKLNEQGRALPHGTCPYVGIGGHIAFGGFGFTSRMWGLTLDTIVAVNTVLANGTIVRVTNDNYPDLFFALRGAAPSYGITTSVEVQTFAAPEYSIVFSYTWELDYQTAAQGLIDFQSFVATPDLPPEFGGELTLTKAETEGNVSIQFIGGWYGSQGALEAVIQPFLEKLPTPKTNDRLGNGSYIDTVSQLGGGLDTSAPDRTDTFYAKSLMTPEEQPLTLEAAQSFMNYLAHEGFNANLSWFMQVELYGGANSKINSVPVDSTAFARRNSVFTWQLYASSADAKPPYPDEGFTFVDGVADSVVKSMPADWDYGAYANYVEDKLDNWEQLYFGNHYDRLKSIKDSYDPYGVFTFPTSIED
ncbi:glucooligosaccharide oxidase [Moniliophthora roreri MCA 2997]|uniref:Glucooligosaccharide oxidase n=2 Tax=Moniliophthora roreri TaxID=221103 RepID=V2XBA2_MONRO|nr:glucooligosaccharide oxidase [Moniliophthora roreri MCA 2997]KAI3599209.1 glucooligosaccharide oxidase [Moniliophthora roreri]